MIPASIVTPLDTHQPSITACAMSSIAGPTFQSRFPGRLKEMYAHMQEFLNANTAPSHHNPAFKLLPKVPVQTHFHDFQELLCLEVPTCSLARTPCPHITLGGRPAEYHLCRHAQPPGRLGNRIPGGSCSGCAERRIPGSLPHSSPGGCLSPPSLFVTHPGP